MLGALLEYAKARQVVIITPFLLMGAMSPVSIPSALVQQLAEVLAGVALMQLVRPGAPVVMGSFLSHTDMKTGSPGFGGPESALGLLASGQIARRYGLPWRSGGGALTSSPAVDAQAAYEGLNTMYPAFLAGANLVIHTAGWLESGLVASFEKAIVDLEIVRDAARAVHAARGGRGEPGVRRARRGAARRALPRLRAHHGALPRRASTGRCSRPPTTSSAGRATVRTTPRRGRARWSPATLEAYEPPPIDPALRDEVRAFVDRRRRELGD